MLSVEELLNSADAIARARAPDTAARWMRVSHSLGSLIPNGSAIQQLQEIGRLDLLIRAMEDEPGVVAHPLVPMSVTWIALSYEMVRALHQRRRDLPGLKPLLERLELVRMPLMKFEIAKDRTMAPIELYRYPAKSSDEPSRTYDKADKEKAYSPIGCISPEGIVWSVVDSKSGQSVWVKRRALADELLALEGPNRAKI